ncbi:MAG TPA: GtrA family protein [Patescibacteria group bacterium]|jgi:putative flippase GtrA|nr:GtrA family protein [Patescibacteria group bacterium]
MDNYTPSPQVLPGQKPALLRQISVFIVVGVINTAVDFAVLNLLSHFTGIKKGQGVIPLNYISFSCAVIVSYFLNKHWTFRDSGTVDKTKQFTFFLIVSVIGASINSLVVYLVTTFVPIPANLLASVLSYVPALANKFGDLAVLWLNLAKLAATAVSLVWNFVGYKLFVFKK